MGGKHGAKCLHALPVELKQLAEIGRRLARQNNMNTPIIDADFSNICFRKGKSVEGAINFMWVQWYRLELLFKHILLCIVSING
jgi:hypothetical protein